MINEVKSFDERKSALVSLQNTEKQMHFFYMENNSPVRSILYPV